MIPQDDDGHTQTWSLGRQKQRVLSERQPTEIPRKLTFVRISLVLSISKSISTKPVNRLYTAVVLGIVSKVSIYFEASIIR